MKALTRGVVKRTFLLLLCTVALLPAAPPMIVRTADELTAALLNLVPGSRIILSDGNYRLDQPVWIQVRGTAKTPVSITARNRGKAVITGPTSLVLRASAYVTIEGLDLRNEGSSAIRLEGCNNIRITRNVFHLQEQGRGSWILVTGDPDESARRSHHNRIDRNLFENKRELGNFITIEGTKGTSPAVSQYDVIEQNHFRNIGPRVENVLEAMRIGSSEFTLSRGFTMVRSNLFERCDGDPEYISIKESDCSVINNTFVECLGSLSLRHGNHSTVEGNVILGKGRTGTFLDSTGKTWTLGTGGIRFCADSMTIRNNYLEGLTGREWDATIAATNGDADYGQGKPLTKHYRITNALLEGNILVNNAGGLEIGYDGGGFQGNWWKLPPASMLIKGNIIAGSSDTLVKLQTAPVDSRFEGNIVWPSGAAVAAAAPMEGVSIKNPLLKRKNGLLLPASRKTTTLRILTAKDVGPDSK